jgi:hypothetical protein
MRNTWYENNVQRWMDEGCPEVDIGDDIVDLENPLEEMLQNLIRLRNLKTLIIAGGFSLPDAFPPALQTLIISQVDIDEFPLQICDLSNLKYLEISLTLIESIPSEIGRLRGLKQLDLSRNAISSIAPELWSLDGVENLSLCSNVRVHIPAEVANMRGLRRIILRDIHDIQIDRIITTLNTDILVDLPNVSLHPDVVAMIVAMDESYEDQIMRGDDQDEIHAEIHQFVFDAFPEDIPLSNDCAVCMEAQHLLILGCRHVVCVGCLNNIQVEKCPVCRKEISRDLIKRKM